MVTHIDACDKLHRASCGVKCIPQKDMLKLCSPVFQNVTLPRNSIAAHAASEREVIQEKTEPLSQCKWCPHKKRKIGTQRGDDVKVDREKACEDKARDQSHAAINQGTLGPPQARRGKE